ncbi:unnamed protein product [Caretta caretta]
MTYNDLFSTHKKRHQTVQTAEHIDPFEGSSGHYKGNMLKIEEHLSVAWEDIIELCSGPTCLLSSIGKENPLKTEEWKYDLNFPNRLLTFLYFWMLQECFCNNEGTGAITV